VLTGTYLPRLDDRHVADLFAQLPALRITGLRATGKTTTARHSLQKEAVVVPAASPGGPITLARLPAGSKAGRRFPPRYCRIGGVDSQVT